MLMRRDQSRLHCTHQYSAHAEFVELEKGDAAMQLLNSCDIRQMKSIDLGENDATYV
jgi:hypothetical protein